MPFTLSHAVLAPPLAQLSGERLPLGALAIGTMTPDLFRLLVKDEIYLNHQWQGIIYPDLYVGLMFCLLWYALYRPLIFKFFNIKKSLAIDSIRHFFSFLFWACLAIIVGTATHIIWDGLTHLDFRTFAFQDFLAQPVNLFNHVYPMHKVLQIGCSAAALPFLAWMGMRYYLKYRAYETPNTRVRYFCYLLGFISILVGCIYYMYTAKNIGMVPQETDLYILIGFFMKTFTQGALVCFSLGCLVFRYLNHQKYFE